MKVSYYELLGMVQEGTNPEQIKLKLNCGERYYQANYDNDEFSYYGLEYGEQEDSNFSYYLANTLLESQMIERNIEIIEEEKDIEELPHYVTNADLLKEVTMNRNKINEIVRKLKDKQ